MGVLECVNDIVTGFETNATTLEVLKERLQSKRWKKDRDHEQLSRIKIVHESLLDVSAPLLQMTERRTEAYMSNKNCRVRHNVADTARRSSGPSVQHSTMEMIERWLK